MNNLITINQSTINNELVQTVNARELHAFLQVKSRFNDWFANRINDYDFIENQDFIAVTKNLVNGGKMIDYFLSLDMGKELSMVERNDKGKQARKYFIDCEKQLLQKTQQVALPTAKDLALMVIQAEEEKERLLLENQQKDEVIEAQRPSVEFVERFVDGSKLYSITEAAKVLGFKRKDFIDCLMRDKYLYRIGGVLVPYETPKCKKLFDVKTGCSEWGRNFTQTKITACGLNKFSDIYSGELLEVSA